ncbi:MAG: heat-inducible transcriptional repressor HrcA [Pseudomonadota bacterium]
MTLKLRERDRRIFAAVVQDYLATAEPVGSRKLSKKYDLEVSPATIRNVMADLEDLGLLAQPHASAGRAPTDLGMRYYVDVILEVSRISGKEKETISQELAGLPHEAEQIIKRTSKVLSAVSRQIGIVLAPKFSRLRLRQLQLVRLSRQTFLVILVGQSGIIQNRIIESDEDLSQDDLDRFNRYLTDILEGLTISEIKVRIVDEMRLEKNRFDTMMSKALALSNRVFQQESAEDDVFIEGRGNLLDYPEFAEAGAMKSLFKAFEDKSILIQLLDKTLNASGVRIFIGGESQLAGLEGYSVIASAYSRGSIPIGTLGVIGPTRLDYSKIIPVVDYTARLISHIFEEGY